MQIMAIGFLFGPMAAGAAAGVNFTRLGRPQLQWPCIIMGIVLFAVEAFVVVYVLEEKAIRPVGMVMNVAIGLGFMLFQKGDFEAWRAKYSPKPPQGKDTYRPNRIGSLFLIGIGCAVAQVGVLFLLFSMQG